jgi:predicted CoA-binding protein
MNQLRTHGHEVVAVGNREGQVGDVMISKLPVAADHVDTVTLYLNPTLQEQYYNYILSLQPKRVIFNPGTENEAFEAILEEKGIEPVEACTLVLLSTGQY